MATLVPQSEHPLAEISRFFQAATRDVEALRRLSPEEATKQATTIARKLVANLENPEDEIMRYAWEVHSFQPIRVQNRSDERPETVRNEWLLVLVSICIFSIS